VCSGNCCWISGFVRFWVCVVIGFWVFVVFDLKFFSITNVNPDMYKIDEEIEDYNYKFL